MKHTGLTPWEKGHCRPTEAMFGHRPLRLGEEQPPQRVVGSRGGKGLCPSRDWGGGGRERQQVHRRPLPCRHFSAWFSTVNLGREGLRKLQKVPEWGGRASQTMGVREGVFTGEKEDSAGKVSLESTGRAHSQSAQSRGGLSARHCSSCPRAPNTPSTQAWMAVWPFRDQIPLWWEMEEESSEWTWGKSLIYMKCMHMIDFSGIIRMGAWNRNYRKDRECILFLHIQLCRPKKKRCIPHLWSYISNVSVVSVTPGDQSKLGLPPHTPVPQPSRSVSTVSASSGIGV